MEILTGDNNKLKLGIPLDRRRPSTELARTAHCPLVPVQASALASDWPSAALKLHSLRTIELLNRPCPTHEFIRLDCTGQLELAPTFLA